MARIRSVKPELPRDARLAKVSRGARLTFLYLITQADDQGYFVATPRSLLGALYPHDPDIREVDLVRELDELTAAGILRAYDTPDGLLGHVVNFARHQKIDHPSKPFLANLSRTPRETFAPGVLSLGVLSPESGAIQEPCAADAARSSEESDVQQRGLKAWYTATVVPICYPGRKAISPDAQARDLSILAGQLRTATRGDVALALGEVRAQAEEGALRGFIDPGDGFGVRVLVFDPKGDVAPFQRFLAAAHKRAEQQGEEDAAR